MISHRRILQTTASSLQPSLLPVQHCLVTFTVPDELRSLLRACPKQGYDAIFAAGSVTIQKLLADPKWLGSPNVGFFGVLHTWGRDPRIYHPGVGKGVRTQLPKRPEGCCAQLSPDPVSNKKWIATPSHFLFPEAVASPIYRQKFREILRAADLEKHVDPAVWRRWWEVNVKPVSDGRAVLKYLAPYVFRVAISDNRILECTDESVTYKYTPSGSTQVLTKTVAGWKFVRGFLQHVLPKGFRKVRHYGWMASNSRTTLERVKWLVWLYRGWTYWLGSGVAPQPERHQNRIRCKDCGGQLHLIALTDGSGRVLVNRSLPQPALANHVTSYLDSG